LRPTGHIHNDRSLKGVFLSTSSGRTFGCYSAILYFLLWGIPQTQKSELQTAQPSRIAGHELVKTYTFENSPLGIFTFPAVSFQDAQGNYWIGRNAGDKAFQYNSTYGWTIFEIASNQQVGRLRHEKGAILPVSVHRINQSKDGRIWFTDGHTLNRMPGRDADVSFYDGRKWEKHEIFVDTQSTWSIGLFRGNDEKLWFWNLDELRSYDGQKWSNTISLANRLSGGNQPTLLQSGANEAKQISLKEKKKFEIFDALQDREGYIWLCTRDGILRFDKRKEEFKRFPMNQLSLPTGVFEDKVGRLWFSNVYSVAVYDKKKRASTFYEISDQTPPPRIPRVNAIYQDHKGQILFGLNIGLLVFREAEKQWEYFSLKEIDTQDASEVITVSHIMEDRAGKIWLTTWAGIIVLEK
jgi:hypothetical protein